MGISGNEIKRIRSLAQKKYRDSLGLFTVEGEKMVGEALASSFTVEEVYRRDEIGEEAMSRISMLASPSPVLAVVRKPENLALPQDCAGDFFGEKGLYLGLDTIRDPGNLGTILRIADWFGVDGILATEDTVDIFNPKVVQATMGAIFRVRFRYTVLPDAIRTLLKNGGRAYGTFMDGENIYTSGFGTGKDYPVMVITGNEADGISEEVESLVSARLAIPSYPADRHGSESLNAAVASAIAVAEFRRRAMLQAACKQGMPFDFQE